MDPEMRFFSLESQEADFQKNIMCSMPMFQNLSSNKISSLTDHKIEFFSGIGGGKGQEAELKTLYSNGKLQSLDRF